MLQLNRLRLGSVVFDKTQEDWLQIICDFELKNVRRFWNKEFAGLLLDERNISLAGGNFDVDYSRPDDNEYQYFKSIKNSDNVYLFSIYGKPGKDSPYDEFFWFELNNRIHRVKYIHQLQNILYFYGVHPPIMGKLPVNFKENSF